MKKKMLAFLMAVLFVVGMFPVTAMAKDPVAKIGEQYYETLQAAIEAVKDNETITMVADVEGAHGISVPSGKNFTVDFDGHTYSTEKPGAGSPATKTQAFQLLKDSTITFKNGTISCTVANKDATWTSDSDEKGVAMLIQNYCNLTLDNMTIDGTNVAHNGSSTRYVVSNNCGTVTIKNSTITATAGDFAFDSCKYGTYAIPTVNVEGSTIKGKVEVTGGNLVIKSGSFTDLATAVKYAENGATIKLADDTNGAADVDGNKTLTLDLNGKNLTLGPAIGSTGTETSGIRVLNGSTLTVKNGKVACSAMQNSKGKYVRVGFANYGTLTLEDVEMNTSNGATLWTINNRGDLTLKGNTKIPMATRTETTGNDGCTCAAINMTPYDYGTHDNAVLKVADSKVEVANIVINDENDPNYDTNVTLNISAGKFGAIAKAHDYTKVTVNGNITGGTFSSEPDAAYIADNYFAKKLSDTEWKVEPEAKVEGTDVKIGENKVEVEGMGGEGQPTTEKAVEAINEALANTAVTTENAKDLGTAINEEIAGGTIVDSEVKVELKTVEVKKSGDNATITEMEFDVVPIAIITTDDRQQKVVEIHKAAAPITFRLPVSNNATSEWAAVYHEGKFMGNYAVKGDATTGKYIEISSREFSKFGYALVDPNAAIAKVDEVPYLTLGEAVADVKGGQTITILKDTAEVVTVERAISFRLVVANGVKFTGAIKPGDHYRRYIDGNKYTFRYYETGDTIVIGGNKDKEKKPDTTKEENPETGAPVMSMGALVVLAAAYVATRKH